MDRDQYLKMIDSQLAEARENLVIQEKSYREAKSKYESMLSFKESYLKWVAVDEVKN